MDTYRGSLIFSPLAERVGLPMDQVNFLIGQLGALAAGTLFRCRLCPGHVTTTTRHVVSALLGLSLLLLCYGRDTVHVVNQAAVTYLIMRLVPAHSVHKVCLVAAMLYLSRIHYWRLLMPRRYMDISGPVMVLTMKTTLLACSIHDGSPACSQTVNSKPNLQNIALRRVPSLLEFASYAFSFQNLLVGPMIDFQHYRRFIEYGSSAVGDAPKAGDWDGNANVIVTGSSLRRGPAPAVLRRIVTATVCALSVLLLVPLVPHSKFKDDEYHTWSVARQWGYMYVAGLAARMKYYTAWSLAEAVCVNSGLGFSDTAQDGTDRWHSVDNVDIWRVELGGSFRESLSGWNLGTARWLRLVVYERTRHHRTAAVYALSALWHGLHPGYYLAFSIGGLCTQADRVGRRHLWPLCENSAVLRGLYSACAFLGARASLAYFHIAFELLDLPASLRVYADTYFIIHIVCIAMMILLPLLLPAQKSSATTSVQATSNPNTSTQENGQPWSSRVTSADHVTAEVNVNGHQTMASELKPRRRQQWVPEISSRTLSGSVCPGDGGATLANRAAKFHVM